MIQGCDFVQTCINSPAGALFLLQLAQVGLLPPPLSLGLILMAAS